MAGDSDRRRLAVMFAAVSGVAAVALVAAVVVTASSHIAPTVLSPLYTKDTHPTLQWNGLPEGYHFHPFIDLEHTDDWTTEEPFGSEGQYGLWQGIQASTMNSYGCGPNGPMDCQVGTTPEQHYAKGTKKIGLKSPKLADKKGATQQQLSPLFTGNTEPTQQWNGLPEGFHFHPFIDLEHTDDWNSAEPFGSEGQYGMWQGMQDSTINSYGCGPDGPMDCSVGTTPSQHYANKKGLSLKKGGMKRQMGLASPWNGQPVNYHNNPFAENPDERVTGNPWGSQGQYGMYQGIQDSTINNGYGCGPAGPIYCQVGTTPDQHWAMVPVSELPSPMAGMMKRQVGLQAA